MKQAQIKSPGILEFENVPELSAHQLKPNEVLLKIERIGVCGGDIHVMHGEHPFVTYPVIQGHEYGASVAASWRQGFESECR